MLHHANVDRLWTYWQFIRPNEAIFTGSYVGMSRFSTPDRTTINANSPLQPFYTSSGSFHTSNSVRSIRGFGYTYQGLEYWQKSDAQMTTDATALINSLYGTGVSGPRKRQEGGSGETTRYFVQVSVDVEQLERPCSINVYVKDQSVGRIIVMKQPHSGTVNGELPLDKATNTIQPQMDAAAKAPKVVVPALLTDLRVEILKVRFFSPHGIVLETNSMNLVRWECHRSYRDHQLEAQSGQCYGHSPFVWCPTAKIRQPRQTTSPQEAKGHRSSILIAGLRDMAKNERAFLSHLETHIPLWKHFGMTEQSYLVLNEWINLFLASICRNSMPWKVIQSNARVLVTPLKVSFRTWAARRQWKKAQLRSMKTPQVEEPKTSKHQRIVIALRNSELWSKGKEQLGKIFCQ
jgi:hypothetical protein